MLSCCNSRHNDTLDIAKRSKCCIGSMRAEEAITPRKRARRQALHARRFKFCIARLCRTACLNPRNGALARPRPLGRHGLCFSMLRYWEYSLWFHTQNSKLKTTKRQCSDLLLQDGRGVACHIQLALDCSIPRVAVGAGTSALMPNLPPAGGAGNCTNVHPRRPIIGSDGKDRM